MDEKDLIKMDEKDTQQREQYEGSLKRKKRSYKT